MPLAPKQPRALLAIATGGLIAGVVDLLQACLKLGWDTPLLIAGGLLGDKADHGGVAIYLLGIGLHFFIAFTWAAIYYAASRRLPFLIEHPLLCGLYFGATVWIVMDLIVLPLSALHATDPTPIRDTLLGLLQKMIVVGLPIAFSIRWFSKQPEPQTTRS